ncbi:MAG: Rieske 2Fe-2S domain-containing protein [Gammaproteobacteria bacterium]|nr:Rieske 2Fe-2S domain-containing protein [Gammaproteobacteria bacterium]MCY4323285.1 Rieske 2Fe-2S domain-containing protein [Gammaproteobacteria bacterium]
MQEVNLPIPFGWFPVAYSKELEVGDVKPISLFDDHQVLFRTESGEAKFLEAFCPHLGAHLGHGGEVVGEHIACPFHAWQLDGEGVVKDIPYAKAIPPKARGRACLHSYPVQERNQMIFAWYHPRRIAPTFDLEDIPEFSDPDWSELETYEWEVNSPIQEMGENAVDIAHFVYVHSAKHMPNAKIELAGQKRITEMVTKMTKIDDQGNIDMEKTEESHMISCNWGPGVSSQVFDRAFKTVLMGTMAPITASRMKLRFAFTKPRDLKPPFDVLTNALITEIVRQVGHDMVIWENKTYRDTPILCDGDGPIAKYRRWFSQFYDDGQDTVPLRLAS